MRAYIEIGVRSLDGEFLQVDGSHDPVAQSFSDALFRRIGGLGPNKKESTLMSSLRRKKDLDVLLQYMTEIMFYQPGSRSGGGVV